MTGSWVDHLVALEKFRGWLGTHGSRAGVSIDLLTEFDGVCEPLRTWTKERGEVVYRAM
ncbi:hypothetical protein [Streptomyces sp. NPDC094149]|uniref:hypothetical protein n=1 Tax=Streptomyces sp. NPDC094149 TaxID=3155079 RepID=UPI0033192AA1